MNTVTKAGTIIREKEHKSALCCASRVHCSQKAPHVAIELGESSTKLTALCAVSTWGNGRCTTKLWRMHMVRRIVKEPWRISVIAACGDKAFRCFQILIAEREKVGWLLNDTLTFATRATKNRTWSPCWFARNMAHNRREACAIWWEASGARARTNTMRNAVVFIEAKVTWQVLARARIEVLCVSRQEECNGCASDGGASTKRGWSKHVPIYPQQTSNNPHGAAALRLCVRSEATHLSCQEGKHHCSTAGPSAPMTYTPPHHQHSKSRYVALAYP